MDVIRLLLYATLCLATAVASYKGKHIKVYCDYTMVKSGSTVTPEYCRSTCIVMALHCKSNANKEVDYNGINGISVSEECINKMGYGTHCIFASDADVSNKLDTLSGIVNVSTTSLVTVDFGKTPFNYPIVFAQAAAARDPSLVLTVRIQEVTSRNFKFLIEDNGAKAWPYQVSWIVINENNMLKDFGAYHVNLFKSHVTNKSNTVIIRKISNGYRSNKIAMLYQTLTPNYPESVRMAVTKDSITLTFKNFKKTATAPKDGPIRATVGILLVDMFYFDTLKATMFGSTPLAFVTPKWVGKDISIVTKAKERPTTFYTPHYNRSTHVVPSSSCTWVLTTEHGYVTCKYDPPTAVTVQPKGEPNVMYMLVSRIDNATEEDLNWHNYGICAKAYSTEKYAELPRYATSQQKLEHAQRKANNNHRCVKVCSIDNSECKGSIKCLRSYLSPFCAIDEKEEVEKVDKTEPVTVRSELLDPLFILTEEIKSIICTGTFIPINKDNVNKENISWHEEASKVCKDVDDEDANKKIIAIIEGYIAKDFCSQVRSLPSEIQWTPLNEFRGTFIKDGMAKSLNTITSEFKLYGICVDKGVTKLMPYMDPVANADELQETNQSLDCIEADWDDWDKCSSSCFPEDGHVYKRRVRSVVRLPSGNGRQCQTEQVIKCTRDELPLCKDTCLLTQWSEWSSCVQSTRTRQRYVKVYHKACDNETLIEKRNCNETDYLEGPVLFYPEEVSRGAKKGNKVESVEKDGPLENYYTKDLEEGPMDFEDYLYAANRENEDEEWNEKWKTEEPYPMHAYEDEAENASTTALLQMGDVVTHEHFTQEDHGPDYINNQVTGSDHFISDSLVIDSDSDNDYENESSCTVWSDWSGCSSVCKEEAGYQYRISSVESPEHVYDVCAKHEERLCTNLEDCSVHAKINCDEVKSIHYLDDADDKCREQCKIIVDQCEEEGHEDNLNCFTRMQDRLIDSADFFFNCALPGELDEKLELTKTVFNNKCFLSKAAYSSAKQAWVDEENQSCFCSIPGSVPCTGKDLHSNSSQIYTELVDSGFCPSVDYKRSFFTPGTEGEKADSLTYISLAGGKRLHCPLPLGDGVFTYTNIDNDELRDYCQHGPMYAYKKGKTKKIVRQYSHKYDCDVAVSTGTMSNLQCSYLCRSLRVPCLYRSHAYVDCIKDRLLKNVDHEALLFEQYGCRLPPALDFSFSEDDYRLFVTTFETEPIDRKACSILVQNAILTCEAEEMLSNDYSFQGCMAAVFGEADVTPAAQMENIFKQTSKKAKEFKDNCKFNQALKAGKGYVMCKFPKGGKNIGDWNEWSQCSENCNDLDKVAVRYRTRNVAKHAENKFFLNPFSMMQFELCLNLGGCTKGRWLDTMKEQDEQVHVLNYKAYKQKTENKMTEWLDQTYNLYPELRNEVSSGATCQIFKSTKIISYKGVTCGCPKKHPPCSFITAMSSPMWMEGMENFCRDRPLASIGFQGQLSNYRYYCNIGMVLAPTEYGNTPECDYYDNNDYVACQAIDDEPLTMRSKHFTIMGICLGLLFAVYATLRRIIIKGRRGRVEGIKED